jgi:SAM-dependent methyltransferase
MRPADRLQGDHFDATRPAPGEIGVRRRASGFLSNLGRVKGRAGWGGLAELVLARASPRWLAYQRTTLIETPLTGRAHPELDPRCLLASEPVVEELYARLAASGEPEVPAFSPAMVRRRFAAGQAAWLFHRDGRPVHARWIVRDRLRFSGVSLPLPAGYCATEAAVTLPEYRGQGLHVQANEHVRAALRDDGAKGMMSAINGFNRRFLAMTLSPRVGARRLATVHTLSFAGGRWVRVVPAPQAHAPAGMGVPMGRWVNSTRLPPEHGRHTWDLAAVHVSHHPYLDPRMAQTKRDAHLELLRRWLPDLESAAVLKTDLWEEGITGDELLFTLARRARSAAGVDISEQATARAADGAAEANVTVDLKCAPIGSLPFADGEVDAVVSTSTLDHIPPGERLPALLELGRVLVPGGVLVITCDNAENVGDWLLGLCARLGLVPFPLEAPLSLAELRDLVDRAGFTTGEHAFLVPGPRVLTTVAVRAARLLPGRMGERAVDGVMSLLEASGRRCPRRAGAFVALRATADGPTGAT